MTRLGPLTLALALAACSSSTSGTAGTTVARSPIPDDVPADQFVTGEAQERMLVPVDGRPVRGSADAWVTIVVFSDFQCPFCSRALPTLDALEEQYGARLRIVFRNEPLPFHEHAYDAAEAAMEAYAQRGDEGFWAMHDLLFENQRALDRAGLLRYARSLGLDVERFRSAVDGDDHRAAIEADLALAARIGANGTPNFFLNGRQIPGAQPLEVFRAVIEQELIIAGRLAERGVAPSDLYEALMRHAQAEAPPPPPPVAAARPSRPDPDATYAVAIPPGRPSIGPDDALVTIVEFSDFECPFCSRVQETLAALRERYGNDLRIVFLHNPLPFHVNAYPAALAAAEAYAQRGSAGFFRVHDLFFENQRDLGAHELERLSALAGIDTAGVRRALEGRTHRRIIEADRDLARRFGASGTPAFYINGRFLGGAQPIERFVELIDVELAEARALVASGTPRSEVYARVVAAGEPRYDDGEPEDDSARHFEVPLPANPIALGSANAPVTLQVFSDFQCPYCRALEPTLERLREHFGSRIRIVWRDYPLPFHDQAMLAAIAAREVFAQRGATAFFAYHDLLFANQEDLGRETLERLARSIQGLDMRRFRAALDTERHRAAIETEMQVIDDLGLERFGTPSTFVNGRLIQGAMDYDTFVDAIEDAAE